MKKIVLLVRIALLAAAGCSKQGPDCSAAVGKGVDGYVASVKKAAASSPRLDITKIADKLKAAMTQRCNDDKWQPDVVTCVGNAASSDDLNACEDKLTRDQKTKLGTVVYPIMMGGMGASGSRMPPGLEGHPPMLGGSSNGSAAAPGDSEGASAPAGSAAAPAPTPSGTPAPPSGGW